MTINMVLRAMARKKAQEQKTSEADFSSINARAEAAARVQAQENVLAAEAKTGAADVALAASKAQGIKSAAQYAEDRTGLQTATTAAQAGLEPWRVAGTDALGKLVAKIETGPGEFTESEGYQARLAEGQRAIERSAAARGGVLSGAALKSATTFGQNFATEDYDNFLSRYYESLDPLQQLSTQGYTAAGQIGDIGTTGARDVANLGVSYADLGERNINALNQSQLYRGEAVAEGKINTSNIIAAQEAAAVERDYAYKAWKSGQNF